MDFHFRALPHRLLGPDNRKQPGYLAARWVFLRGLGLIYFRFSTPFFQIRETDRAAWNSARTGISGGGGAPVGRVAILVCAHGSVVVGRDRTLLAICVVGMIASLLLTINISPRAMLLICLVLFLSFVAAAQDFSGYQSDGMLLEAGFLSLFFAPEGWRPGWGEADPASQASRLLLLWLWFRIYFESGVAKILGHDPQWRNFTAMDEYYQNGPLPTWIAWYAHQLPHGFHAVTAGFALALELVLIFVVFLRRPFRIALFFVVTILQIGIILSSNYAFLNYIVLILGILLLDDAFFTGVLGRCRRALSWL